jgi:ankyrin repeat protein
MIAPDTEIGKNIDQVKAIEFLLRAGNIESGFEIAIFKQIMESQLCITLLIDGFDEISPHYKKEVFELILALRSTKNFTTWITTRPHLRTELEDQFQTFACTLKPLNKGAQERLINGFWKTKIRLEISPNKECDIEKYAQDILALFSQSIAGTNPEEQFAGIPLQTVLLAEYFYDNVKEFFTSKSMFLPPLPSRLNVLDLYTQFVQSKYKIYCEEKKGQDMTNVANIVDNILLSEHFMDRHETFALSTLFGEKNAKSLLIAKGQRGGAAVNEIAEGKERAGLIVDIVNQIPIFSHRTFAEYFAAGWFAKNMDNLRANNFLRKVLFRNGNEILRNFFDRILCKENCELHTELLNGDKTKISELLLGSKVDIKAVDRGGRTALHLAVVCADIGVVRDLLSRGNDVSVRDGLFGWCAAIYADRCTKLDIAIFLLQKMEHQPETLSIIEEYDQLLNDPDTSFYLGHCIRRNNTLLHLAVGKEHLTFVDILIRNGFCFDVGNVIGRTAFHDAVFNGSKQIVERFVESYFNSVDGSCGEKNRMVRDLINLTDMAGNNSLSYCCSSLENCEDLCKYLIQKYVDTLSMLKQSDSVAYFSKLEGFFNWKNINGYTPLSIVCYNKTTKCGKLWLRKYVEYVSELKLTSLSLYYNQLGRFFNVQNERGNTPLHLAVFHHELDFVQCLTDSYSNALASMRFSDSNLYQKKFHEFLNGVDNEGNTPLCLASKRQRGARICEYLIQKNLQTTTPLKEYDINAKEDGLRRFRMVFSHRNNKGDTPIALACAYGNLNRVKMWTNAYDLNSELKVVSAEECFNQMNAFVSSKNKNGLTPLHLAAKEHSIRKVGLNIVKWLVEFYSNALAAVNPADIKGNRDKLLAFLNVADNYGNTPLCLAITNYHLDIFDYLISKHLSILHPLEAENPNLYRDELRKLFFHTNFNGDTPLALACATGEWNCIEIWIRTYINYIRCIKMTEDESTCAVLKRYLYTENKDGKTPLALAKYCCKYSDIMDLIKSYETLCICASADSCDSCS